MSEKIIDEFEEMIVELCGTGGLKKQSGRPKGTRPTPDFYDLPIHHKDFMEWYEERDREKRYMKITTKCDCGVIYKIYTEPFDTLRYVHDFQGQGSTSASTDWHTHQIVHIERFHCWKCGKPFSVTGNKILKIKSNQLEVVL